MVRDSNKDHPSYELIFDGPKDGHPDTLRRLRGALLMDLKYDIERARTLLDQAPCCIREAGSAEELEPLYQSLKRSGARVFILPQDQQEENLEEQDASPIRAESEIDDNPLASELEFEFDLDEDDDEFVFDLDTSEERESLRTDLEEEIHSTDSEVEEEVEAMLAQLESGLVEREEPCLHLVQGLAGQRIEDENDFESEFEAEKPGSAWQPELEADSENSKKVELRLVSDSNAEPIPDELEQDSKPNNPFAVDVESLLGDKAGVEPKARTIDSTRSHTKKAEAPKRLKDLAKVSKSGADDSNQSSLTTVHIETPDEILGFHITLPKSNKWRVHLPLDMLFGVLCGVVILFLGNYIYFSRAHSSAGSVSFDKYFAELLMQREMSVPDKLKELTPTTITSIIGMTSSDVSEIRSRFIFQGTELTDIKLSLATPQPKDLSLEEIGRHEEPRPWLKKLIVDNMKVEYRPDGTFVAKGFGKTYVEQGDRRYRSVSDVLIQGKVDSTTNFVKADLIITQGQADFIPNPDLSIEKIQEGLYWIDFRAEIKANRRLIEKL